MNYAKLALILLVFMALPAMAYAETFNEGERITNLKGVNGNLLEIKVDEIQQTGTTAQVQAKLSLYIAQRSAPIETKTVSAGAKLEEVFSGLETKLLVNNIGIEATTGIGYIEITREVTANETPMPGQPSIPSVSESNGATPTTPESTSSTTSPVEYTGKPYFRNYDTEYTFVAKTQLHIKFDVYGTSWEQFAVYTPNNSLPEGWTYETKPESGHTGVHLWVPDPKRVKEGTFYIKWITESDPNNSSTMEMKVNVLPNAIQELTGPAFKNMQENYQTMTGRNFAMSFDVYGNKNAKISVYPTSNLPEGAIYGNDFETDHTRVNFSWVPTQSQNGIYEITFIAKVDDSYQSKATFKIIVEGEKLQQPSASGKEYESPNTIDGYKKIIQELQKEIEMLKKKIEALQSERNIAKAPANAAIVSAKTPPAVSSTSIRYTGNVEIVKPAAASPISVSVENGSTTVSTGNYRQEIDETLVKKALQNKGIDITQAREITVLPVTENGSVSYEVKMVVPNETPVINWIIPTVPLKTSISSAEVIDAAGK